jgi:acetoin utilization deacetylase AcuC-like enzyme
MRIFFAPEQLLHDPKQEFAAGGFRPAMEVQERATSVLAAIEAAAAGPVAVPADYGLQPVARVHDPNLLAFLNSADAQWSQTFPQTHPYPETSIARRMRPVEPISLRGKLAYYCFDTATPVLAGSWSSALRRRRVIRLFALSASRAPCWPRLLRRLLFPELRGDRRPGLDRPHRLKMCHP